MSFSWDPRADRPPYGDGGAIDPSAVFNDPRFADAVMAAVKSAPTMRGSFPHGSIDPRAIEPVPVMAALPGTRERYDGMVVDLHPNGPGTRPVRRVVFRQGLNNGLGGWTAISDATQALGALPGSGIRYEGYTVDYWPSGTPGSGVCWRCTWRDAANSGSGAWVVVGGGPPIGSRVDGAQAVTGFSTPVALSGNTVLTPVPGVYACTAHVGMAIGTAGGIARAGAGRTSSLPDANSGFATGSTATVPGSGRRVVTTTPSELSIELYGWPDNSAHTATFTRRTLLVHPVELHP